MLSFYDVYSGINLTLDQFKVNSFIFIDNEPLIIISVDNFGILILDIISKSIVDKICFNSMISNFPKMFSIIKIIPIGNTSIRILLENKNGFSLLWKGIAKIGDQDHVLINLTVSEYHVGVSEGIKTNLIDGTKNGYSRFVLIPIKDSDIK